jgi:cytochrome P450
MSAAKRPAARPPTLSGLRLIAMQQKFVELPAFFTRISREYGPIVRFANLWSDVYFVNEPAAIEEVLVTKATSFRKGRGTVRLRRLLGNGLLTAERPEHLPHRRLVAPAFHRKRLDDYARVMTGASVARVATWPLGDVLDIDREFNRLALEIAAKALFGADLRSDMDTIAGSLVQAMSSFPASMLPFSEVWDDWPLPSVRRFKAAKARLDAIVRRMIAEHRAEGVDRGDVLSMLLATRDEESRVALDDDQIRDEAMTILLAGHETTANALAWTFYLLQRNPDVEATLHAHVDAVLGGRTPTLDDVPRLEYVRAVFAETMRLYPPAWVTARRATEDVDLGSYRIRRGDVAIVSQYVTQRDPRFWSDPERFDPARFIVERPRERFAYFPFGGGTRTCIGEAFAWTEGVLAIATIAQRVRLESVGDGDVATLPLVTLRPRAAIRARVTARAPAPLRNVSA